MASMLQPNHQKPKNPSHAQAPSQKGSQNPQAVPPTPKDFESAEKIIERVKFAHSYKYKVKWQNHGWEESTYESRDRLMGLGATLLKQIDEHFDLMDCHIQNHGIEKPQPFDLLQARCGLPQPELHQSDFFSTNRGSLANKSIGGAKLLGKRAERKENEQVSVDELYGDFEYDDKPLCIKKARRVNCEENETKVVLEFIVEWNQRINAYKPKDSVITNLELRRKDPNFLIDFYESCVILKDSALGGIPQNLPTKSEMLKTDQKIPENLPKINQEVTPVKNLNSDIKNGQNPAGQVGINQPQVANGEMGYNSEHKLYEGLAKSEMMTNLMNHTESKNENKVEKPLEDGEGNRYINFDNTTSDSDDDKD